MKKRKEYQPKTGQACCCRPGAQRDNCPACEGTGMQIDFKAIRNAGKAPKFDPTPLEILEMGLACGIFDDAPAYKADVKACIARAVNAREDLLSTVKGLLEFGIPSVNDGWKYQRISAVDKVRKAIAKAESK